jgi:hypothetical protein
VAVEATLLVLGKLAVGVRVRRVLDLVLVVGDVDVVASA